MITSLCHFQNIFSITASQNVVKVWEIEHYITLYTDPIHTGSHGTWLLLKSYRKSHFNQTVPWQASSLILRTDDKRKPFSNIHSLLNVLKHVCIENLKTLTNTWKVLKMTFVKLNWNPPNAIVLMNYFLLSSKEVILSCKRL